MVPLGPNHDRSDRTTEIIAVASGKGGTGKTLILASLGYALQRADHRVLFIDTDMATDGLSLFLLGPDGIKIRDELQPENTFAGYLEEFKTRSGDEPVSFRPFRINRGRKDDHGQTYNGIISGRGLYGDRKDEIERYSTPDIPRVQFLAAIKALFSDLRNSGHWDYVLVDTRGGFSFGTTDICALADKFFLVTEPAFTSFYQDKSLIRLVSEAGSEVAHKGELRGVVVNKATEFSEADGQSLRPVAHNLNLDAIEPAFRNLIMEEFSLRYSDTYPIPLDINAVSAYKSQKLTYVTYPGCMFSYATLVAFSNILKVVTVQWPERAIAKWNEFADEISEAISAENEKTMQQVEAAQRLQSESARLREQNEFYATQLQELQGAQRQRTEVEVKRLEYGALERRRFLFMQSAVIVSVAFAGLLFFWFYATDLTRQLSAQQALLDKALADNRSLLLELQKVREPGRQQ